VDAQFAKYYAALLRERDAAGVARHLDASLRGPQLGAQLERLFAAVPRATPIAAHIVSARIDEDEAGKGATRRVSLSYEYEYADAWLLVTLRYRRRGDDVVVSAVNLQPLTQ